MPPKSRQPAAVVALSSGMGTYSLPYLCDVFFILLPKSW